MPTPKKPGAVRGRPPKKPEPDAPEVVTLTIRGLTPDIVEGLDRATKRRRDAVGGFVSQNTACLALLRAAIAAEDASGFVAGTAAAERA